MKSSLKIILILITITAIAFVVYKKWRSEETYSLDTIIRSDNKIYNMKISSSAFEDSQYIPSKYTCDGEDRNPRLLISGVPEETKSLVLIIDDPDAPSGNWVHWTVFNISPDIKEISEDSVPQGAIEGRTDFKKPGYGGPCPSVGIHHYQFKLYALNIVLNLDSLAGKKDIEKAINGHILAKDFLVGLYERKR